MEKAVIVSAVRTPIGSFGGVLGRIEATDLGAHVIKAAIGRAGISPNDVDACIMGQVLSCGCGQNPARLAGIKAGLPWEVDSFTVNKVCGSSLKAVMLAAQAIQTGDADVVVAGGMENMSLAPYYMPKARWGYRMGPGNIEDHMLHDGLWDVINDFHMGVSNELCCEKWQVSRAQQDEYAAESYRRANAAEASGRFKDEMVPIDVPGPGGKTIRFDRDECLKETTIETLAAMKPVFKKDGVGTAGNASKISDGASALMLMGESKATEMGCKILAKIGAQSTHGIDMKYVLMAPLYAIPKLLKKHGIGLKDIDLFEINEAFSGSSVGINQALGLDPSKVNVNGGCVALGHPIGASGARVLTTLLYEMEKRDVHTGLTSLCLGGGEAVALVVNR